jgi:hypothetical protein
MSRSTLSMLMWINGRNFIYTHNLNKPDVQMNLIYNCLVVKFVYNKYNIFEFKWSINLNYKDKEVKVLENPDVIIKL